MVLFNYNSIQKIAVFFSPIVTLLALTIGGVQKVGRDLDTLKKKPSFWKNRYFYIVCKSFARVNITDMALSFQFIYLLPLYIDRQIKMNLFRGSMHATSLYSSDSFFLFSLKHNLSFLFKIPSSLSHSLSKQVFKKPCCPSLFQRLC